MPEITEAPSPTPKPYCEGCGLHNDDCNCENRAVDVVNHPPHYTQHPSGVECIDITEHFGFCTGNAIKYIWRAGLKGDNSAIQDLQKAKWYLEREISRIEAKDH